MSIETKFETASRLKLRFATVQGPLGVEDLWTLPLTTTNPGKYTSLDEIARSLHKKLKTADTDAISFVTETVGALETEQLSFDLVLHVITIIKAENKARSEEHAKAQKKQKLLALLDRKEDAATEALTADEIRAQIAAL